MDLATPHNMDEFAVDLQRPRPKLASWKRYLTETTRLFIDLALYLLCLKPFTELPLVNEMYAGCWITGLLVGSHFIVRHIVDGKKYSLSLLMSSILILSQIITHMAIVLDSLVMKRKYANIYERLNRVVQRMARDLLYPMDMEHEKWTSTIILMPTIATIVGLQVLVIWINERIEIVATRFYWYLIVQSLALQFKILSMLTSLMVINYRLRVVYENVNCIGERNLRRVHKSHLTTATRKHKTRSVILVVPQGADACAEDTQQLAALKGTHGDIYSVFRYLNDCFGWSLLAILTVCFIDFVCNSYWVILAFVTEGRSLLILAFNLTNVFKVIILFFFLCWNCQQSTDYGRNIGCIAFKLVKPSGNKRYNDLATEFSLQTLHLRFFITAKDFFNVNHNAMGGMVAAFVTYLVILIQFMLNENSRTKGGLNSNAKVTATVSSANLTQPLATATALMSLPTAHTNSKN